MDKIIESLESAKQFLNEGMYSGFSKYSGRRGSYYSSRGGDGIRRTSDGEIDYLYYDSHGGGDEELEELLKAKRGSGNDREYAASFNSSAYVPGYTKARFDKMLADKDDTAVGYMLHYKSKEVTNALSSSRWGGILRELIRMAFIKRDKNTVDWVVNECDINKAIYLKDVIVVLNGIGNAKLIQTYIDRFPNNIVHEGFSYVEYGDYHSLKSSLKNLDKFYDGAFKALAKMKVPIIATTMYILAAQNKDLELMQDTFKYLGNQIDVNAFPSPVNDNIDNIRRRDDTPKNVVDLIKKHFGDK